MNATHEASRANNVGFVVSAALASICFSWMKTFDANEEYIKNIVKNSGETFVLSAILFLFRTVTIYTSALLIRVPDKLRFSEFVSKVGFWVGAIFNMVAVAISIPKILVLRWKLLRRLVNDYMKIYH